MRRRALWYVEHGIPVFPIHHAFDGKCSCTKPDCQSPGKHPRTVHGFKDATTDPEQIAEWWRKWPNANIAIPTGAASGLLVVDIDPRNGGKKSLARLIRKYGDLPNTAEQITGGGGHHIIFRYRGGRVPKSLAPGIDLKGDGGYIVAAPSIHQSGRRYRWNNGDAGRNAVMNPADAPAWLLKRITRIATACTAAANTGPNGGKWRTGERNTRLTSIAGTMRRPGMSQASIEAALLTENRLRCDPPLLDEEVQRIAASVAGYEASDDGGAERSASPQRRSQATQLVEIASAAELFHSVNNEPFATVEANSHRENWRLNDREFKRWLAHRFFEQYKNAPSANAMSEALSVLEGKALYECKRHTVFSRIARHEDALYLDLGTDDWTAVKITGDGWKIVNPRVRFRRPRGLLALPRPERGGSLKELWTFVNVRDKDRTVLAAWLVGTYQFGAPFPVLVLQGEQGSAKSTLARFLRSLIDPNKSPLRSQPREIRDLMIAAQNGWLIAFDNISSLPVWLSDALCSLATGGGFATRELHSDDREILFDATRPILLNGIDGVVIRGDLVDRSLVLELPEIPKQKRRPEKDLWASFRAAQPGIFGALLDAVSAALRNEGASTLTDLPRMADFAVWASGAEPALALKPGEVIAALNKNQVDLSTLPLDASPITPALRKLLNRDKAFTGTATDLSRDLDIYRDRSGKHPRGWPVSAHALSCALRRLAPNLRAAGVHVRFKKSDGVDSRRMITIKDELGHFSDASDASDADEDG